MENPRISWSVSDMSKIPVFPMENPRISLEVSDTFAKGNKTLRRKALHK